MEIIGHRGCGAQYPENTIRAVTAAARYVETVEVDVRRCGSGELVVLHDATVDRVTDGSGPVAELTLEELRDLDVLASGEHVPLVAEVLDAVPDDVTVQLELKEPGLAGDVRAAAAAVPNDVILTSFLPEALAEVDALDASLPTGFLFDHDPAANVERALDLGCTHAHPHYDLCLDTNVVERAHDRGLRVVAWKAARTAAEVERLRAAGVDGVTADRWDIG